MASPEDIGSRVEGILAHDVSRRGFLDGGLKLFAGVMVAGMVGNIACGVAEKHETFELKDLKPDTEAEKLMMPTLALYNEVRSATKANDEQAAILTQAALHHSDKHVPSVIASYNAFRSNNSASEDEATVLTVSSSVEGADAKSVGSTFEQARNALGGRREQAANVTAITTFTGQSLDSVLYYYPRVESVQPQKELVPIVVTARLVHGEGEQTTDSLRKTADAGITDKRDVAAILYADTFTNAEFDDMVTIQKELADLGVDANARGDLLVAAVLNHHDLESVIEMYNFAGALKGVNQEAAAKLVLATISSNNPTFVEKTTGQPASNGDRRPTGGGGVYPIIVRGGGYYGPYRYGAYPRSSTGFRAVGSPSFSRPGVAPVRGTGGSRGTGGLGGRGGVSGGGAKGGGTS